LGFRIEPVSGDDFFIYLVSGVGKRQLRTWLWTLRFFLQGHQIGIKKLEKQGVMVNNMPNNTPHASHWNGAPWGVTFSEG